MSPCSRTPAHSRFDLARFAEAVLGDQVQRALRMLDGLRAEGEAAVLAHRTLAADIQALERMRGALERRPAAGAAGGARLGRQAASVRVPGADARRPRLAQLLEAASVCDELAKGLRHPDWPAEPWDALRRLLLMTLQAMAPAPRGGVGRRLALGARANRDGR